MVTSYGIRQLNINNFPIYDEQLNKNQNENVFYLLFNQFILHPQGIFKCLYGFYFVVSWRDPKLRQNSILKTIRKDFLINAI
jgi:hypothetical protein